MLMTLYPFDVIEKLKLDLASPEASHAYKLYSTDESLLAAKLELDTTTKPFQLSVISDTTPFELSFTM